MLFAIATPVMAYNRLGPSFEWKSNSPGLGWDYYIHVCLRDNFKGNGTVWDMTRPRIKRVSSGIDTFNAMSADAGLNIRYARSVYDCGDLTAQNKTHLEVGWSPDNTSDGIGGTLDLAQAVPAEYDGFPCITHCAERIFIQMDDENELGSQSWYMGDSGGDVPFGTFDFEQVFIHELGHASGLAHSGQEVAVMCAYDTAGSGCKQDDWILGPGQAQRSYKPDDINGFKSVW